MTIYYRPPDPNQKKDYGHIFIYVRNDDTGESAYFDYIADGWPATVIILNGVDQQRIDNHAGLTIETRPDQEQAILNGIKEMQQSAPGLLT